MANLKDINYGIGKYLEASDASDIPDIGTNRTNIDLLNFKVATNNAYALYNFKDGIIDAFQDTSGIDAGNSTNEIRDGTGEYYIGTVAASGGTITSHGSYTVHTFLDDGNFVVGQTGTVDALIIGGGGCGGQHQGGGGGGAGGMVTRTSIPYVAGTYAVTVGAGGISCGGFSCTPTDAEDSTLAYNGGTYTAERGGRGGGASTASQSGGSGGGGGGTGPSSGGSGNSPSQPGQAGNAGGDGQGNSPNASPHLGAGGGGAGGGGQSHGSGGDGGAGATNDYRTGSNVTYAGGGGGGAGTGSSSASGNGGSGGGGDGAGAPGFSSIDGTANTGSGGGGNNVGAGGTGGSGIVVIRYTGSLGSYVDMTLVSTATTAQAAPTKADFVMTYTDGVGTTTVNTDLKAYASRDDGTTWTQLTLASQGIVATHTILTAHDLDISGQPSGTAMKYKITTHNQSATKETRVHAVSLGWS